MYNMNTSTELETPDYYRRMIAQCQKQQAVLHNKINVSMPKEIEEYLNTMMVLKFKVIEDLEQSLLKETLMKIRLLKLLEEADKEL
jgi:hypothetical protein